MFSQVQSHNIIIYSTLDQQRFESTGIMFSLRNNRGYKCSSSGGRSVLVVDENLVQENAVTSNVYYQCRAGVKHTVLSQAKL